MNLPATATVDRSLLPLVGSTLLLGFLLLWADAPSAEN